jgi:hypothetical protein
VAIDSATPPDEDIHYVDFEIGKARGRDDKWTTRIVGSVGQQPESKVLVIDNNCSKGNGRVTMRTFVFLWSCCCCCFF